MAKNKQSKSKKQRTRPRQRRTGPRIAMSPKQMAYAKLLKDPCGADVPTGSYPGEVGIVQRFISENTMVGAAANCGVVAFHPNTGYGLYFNAPTSNIGSAFTYSAPNFPGNAFLGTNAQKVRGLAACIQGTCSSLSITNITGEIAVGCVSADTLNSVATTSVDGLFTLLQARGAVTRDIKEVKWTPGSFDDKYATYVSGATAASLASTGTDLSDTNILVFAVRNVPTGTVINLRITWVVEWTPRTSIGLAPSNQASGGINHTAVAAAVHQAHPSWWHNLADAAGSAVSGFANTFMGTVGNYTGQRVAQRFLTGSSASYAAPIIEEIAEAGALMVI